jgi:hypothetical protein
VVNEIVTTLKKMPIEHSFQHAKGHQDDKIAYADLPLDAKLNVDADAEAGENRYYNPEPRPMVPRLPSNSAQARDVNDDFDWWYSSLAYRGDPATRHLPARVPTAYSGTE